MVVPEYNYKSISAATGEVERGTYIAKSKQEVVDVLRGNKQMPVWVREKRGTMEISLSNPLDKIKTKDFAIFCRQFYTMLYAGIPIIGILDILRGQSENKRLKKALDNVYEEVQKGVELSTVLEKQKEIFPELLIHMVEAGEASGNLDVIMERMAIHYEKESKINNKIQAAMIYPMIISIVAIVVVFFLITSIMPTFVSIFEGSGVPLPAPTQILLNFSKWLKKFWHLGIVGISIISIAVGKIFKSEKGKFVVDYIKLKVPIINSAIIKISTARFTRTFATLLSSGIPLIQALDIVSKIVGNKVIEVKIQKVIEAVKKGEGLSKPIYSMNLFPPMVTSMISIGEETGALDELLDKTANFYDDEVETAILKMTTLIEPLMIVVMAVVVGGIVVAMVLPMFTMLNSL